MIEESALAQSGGVSFHSSTRSQESMKVIVFQVKEYRCALRVEEVEELLPMAKLWKTPGMPAAMEGTLNLGGKIIPVFRMDKIFKTQEIPLLLYTPILLVKSEKGAIGFIIEKAIGVHTIESKDIASNRGSVVTNDAIEAEITIGDERVALLSVKNLLFKEELENVGNYDADAQSRKKQEQLLKNIAA